jgi:LuxR family transcriptional regulator, maltose regulon positive regulatory protein
MSRPDLLDRIGEGLSKYQRLSLVTAPAGYGKTSLVSDWALRQKIKIAWLSLDSGDSDLFQFLNYFFAGIQRANPDFHSDAFVDIEHFRESMMLLVKRDVDQQELLDLEDILAPLVNDILTQLPGFVFVLDDYHQISNPLIDQVLRYFIDKCPFQREILKGEKCSRGVHWVIVTRADPNLPLAKYRAHGQLSELRQEDLRFTKSETFHFLNQIMDIGLDEEQIDLVNSRTEGWVTGLYLLAYYLQNRPDLDIPFDSMISSPRFILDYLMEEVIKLQSLEVQDFLYQTSILQRLCPPLCDHVTQSNRSEEMLDYLEKSNLFIVSLDMDHFWFRYHPLFSELLQKQMLSTSKYIKKELHLRAYQWFLQHEMIKEAVDHAIWGENPEKAEEIIVYYLQEYLIHGQLKVLFQWMNFLPERTIRTKGYVGKMIAWAMLFDGQFSRMRNYIQISQNAYELEYRSEGRQLHRYDRDIIDYFAIEAYLQYFQGSIDESLESAREGLENYIEPAERHIYWLRRIEIKGIFHLCLGMAHFETGETAESERHFVESLQLEERYENYKNLAYSILGLYRLYCMQGRFDQATVLIEDYLQKYGASMHDKPSMGMLSILSARLAFEKKQSERIDNLLQTGEYFAKSSGWIEIQLQRAFLSAEYWQLQNESNKAQLELDHVRKLVIKRQNLCWKRELDISQMWLNLFTGKLNAVSLWAEERMKKGRESRFVLDYREDLLISAYFVSTGQFEGANQLLNGILEFAKSSGMRVMEMEVKISSAILNERSGKLHDAEMDLDAVLEIAGQIQYEYPIRKYQFLMGKHLFARLLREENQHLKAELLTGDRDFSSKDKEILIWNFEESQQRLLNETLSTREIEVLYYICQGLKDREIAEKLYISVHTVKSHVHHLLGKLQVQSRVDAVQIFREMSSKMLS